MKTNHELRRDFKDEALAKQAVFGNKNLTFDLKQFANFKEWYIERCKELFCYNRNTILRHFDAFFVVYGYEVLQKLLKHDENV